MAATYCAKELGIPITVVVPEPTPEFIVKKLAEEGATVEVVGKVGKGRQYNQCKKMLSIISRILQVPCMASIYITQHFVNAGM